MNNVIMKNKIKNNTAKTKGERKYNDKTNKQNVFVNKNQKPFSGCKDKFSILQIILELTMHNDSD